MYRAVWIFSVLSLLGGGSVWAQLTLRGKVVSSDDGKAITGATVSVGGVVTVSGADGAFRLVLAGQKVVGDSVLLKASFLGYIGYQQKLVFPSAGELVVRLFPMDNNLSEVTVSTGYNKVARERATGSFVQVDNKLLERQISTNVIDRLRDVVPGLVFNRTKGLGANELSIGIRGQSTLYANTQPLIVLDNFPYDGDISNINPNDIESITVLKDAAAASIWGARSANGVIVLTSKRAKKNQPLLVAGTVNFTVGEQPDLTRNNAMSSSDFIDVERLLFDRGFYSGTESSVVKMPLTPAVELFIAARDGKLSSGELSSRLDALKGIDVRKEYMSAMGNSSFFRQYALNVSGSSGPGSYYLSAGYDENRLSDKMNSNQRMTLNFSDRFTFLSDRLTVELNAIMARSVAKRPNDGYGSLRMSVTQLIYPYAQLADGAGQSLAVTRDFRSGFLDGLAGGPYLDWRYRPVDEIYLRENSSETLDYRINGTARYRLLEGLSLEASFQFGKLATDISDLDPLEGYAARDLINRFTQVSSTGSVTYPVPLGGILDKGKTALRTLNFRGQLNYQKSLAGFEFNGLAGYEWRDLEGSGYQTRFYGYNPLNAASTTVDYVNPYPQSYFTSVTGVIPSVDALSGTADRFLSFYGNASLAYLGKYTLSGSVRMDRSNLFGVSANQKGVPLWSVGGLWNIAREGFYDVPLLPVLRARLTFGYNGNIDKNLSALTTARYFNGLTTLTRLPYAVVLNPPNPELRWERVRTVNAGLDFGFRGNRVSGTLELYHKTGLDLISDIPFAPSSGVTTFRGNMANTVVKGIDFNVSTLNIKGELEWSSNFWLSYTRERVTRFLANSLSRAQNYAQSADAGTLPREGYPLYGMYSYRYAGLDDKGNPMGYLGGVASTDYAAIFAAADLDNIIYSGSAKPVLFGSLMNTLRFKGISLSANIAYRAGYYFRRSSVNYVSVLAAQGGHSDFAQRWKVPGDEALTDIPGIPLTASANRDNMYLQSEALVERGDHIRLQDVRLSFDIPQKYRLGFRSVQLNMYAANLGIIWRANKKGIDPDYQAIPLPRSIAFGLKLNF
ncbi:SusC/RagA family TonB-linked outer membrane protein [Pedobacter rhizosphaerae]|uniref:TonB-linked outer membrane protein, SusC/RagA family n=1 Tax=Pedobacter rhizosphaerae TaxID=390241 RepID=A0A1H9N487_9SPHI|nr:SusC/RagA family TonB-linked outer membrane protein [Pedobacter rhizosphaerae]SER30223.1 TonB-linked outer membrane protein, SusC/RagA family [Pedobacter rhizosphaerae]